MKKNITINLCGRLFQIDEDAYEMLQQYIDSLRASFGKQDGGEEIADDIEERIAELFDELKAKGTVAITIDHVKNIIIRIGKPEQLAGEDDETQNGAKEGHHYDSFRTAAEGIREEVRARTAGKRLYRNSNDKMVAGVMSGIATYTNTDPVVWRLLAVLFTFFYGVGILLYIVLAIVIPEANTPEEQLQMEGKDVTPQNLADVVVDDQQPQRKKRGVLHEVLSVFLKIVFGLFVGIAAIIGLVLLLCFLLIVGTLIFVFLVPIHNAFNLPFHLGYLNLAETFFLHPWAVAIFVVGLLLALFIPLYAIAHMLLSNAGRVQPMGTGQRIGWIIVWLIALFSIFPSVSIIKNFNEWQRFEYQAETQDWMTDVARAYLKEHNLKVWSRHHCFDDFVKSGQYFTGDSTVSYVDVEMWGPEGERYFQLSSHYGQDVEPGIYRISCNARAEAGGVCMYVTAFNGSYKAIKMVPASGKEGGLGYGWQHVEIEVKIDAPTILFYGISTDPKFTEVPCHAKWFSAADFKVERVDVTQ